MNVLRMESHPLDVAAQYMQKNGMSLSVDIAHGDSFPTLITTFGFENAGAVTIRMVDVNQYFTTSARPKALWIDMQKQEQVKAVECFLNFINSKINYGQIILVPDGEILIVVSLQWNDKFAENDVFFILKFIQNMSSTCINRLKTVLETPSTETALQEAQNALEELVHTDDGMRLWEPVQDKLLEALKAHFANIGCKTEQIPDTSALTAQIALGTTEMPAQLFVSPKTNDIVWECYDFIKIDPKDAKKMGEAFHLVRLVNAREWKTKIVIKDGMFWFMHPEYAHGYIPDGDTLKYNMYLLFANARRAYVPLQKFVAGEVSTDECAEMIFAEN